MASLGDSSVKSRERMVSKMFRGIFRVSNNSLGAGFQVRTSLVIERAALREGGETGPYALAPFSIKGHYLRVRAASLKVALRLSPFVLAGAERGSAESLLETVVNACAS